MEVDTSVMKGRLQRLVGAYERTFFRLSPPALRAGEEVVRKTAAERQGALPTIGHLYLTTERLVYVPMRPRLSIVPDVGIDIELSWIDSVESVPWHATLWTHWPGYGGWRVTLRDGQAFTMKSDKRDWWLARLQPTVTSEQPA
jgi:hypothetical protein